MIESIRKTSINNWLNGKLNNRESGIIFAELPSDYFAIIQDFLESHDRPHKTSAIYYEAFPEESAAEFLATLCHELTAKFSSAKFNNLDLTEIVANVELKMVIIDRSYLHPLDTSNKIISQLASCNVGIISIGSRGKMQIARVLDLPSVESWDRLDLDGESENSAQN